MSIRNKEGELWHCIHHKVRSSSLWLFWFHSLGRSIRRYPSCLERIGLPRHHHWQAGFWFHHWVFLSSQCRRLETYDSLWPMQWAWVLQLHSWFKNHTIAETDNWIFLGDFNFYRSINHHNRPGGNIQDTLVSNKAIGHLGLVELPLKGKAYTWNNMQAEPLLEQLDWFFTSVKLDS